MKALKIFSAVLAALVLIAGGALAYLYATFDAARIKQEISAAVQAKTGRVLAIEGDLSLSIWPNVGVKLGKLSLSEADGKQNFAKLDHARVAVALMPLLSKQVVVKAVEVDGLAANLVKHKDGTLNISDLTSGKQPESAPIADEPAKASGGAAPKIEIDSIRISKGKLDWRDEQTGKHLSLANLDLSSGALQLAEGRVKLEAFSLSAQGQLGADTFKLALEVPKLALSPEGASSEVLKLVAGLEGQGKKLSATLAIKGVSGSLQALKVEQFGLDADVTTGETRAVAQLTSPVALDLGNKVVALSKLGGKLELTDPKLPMKTLNLPLAGGAEVHYGKPAAKLHLSTQADGSQIQAKVDVAQFAPMALAFDLDIDQLDLDKYLPPAKPAEGGSGSGSGSGGASSPPAVEARINLMALKGLNMKGNIKIGQLVAKKIKASAIRVQLDAEGGRLNVAPLAANLYEGRLEGAVSVDANSNRFGVRQNLTGVQINPLLKDLAGKDMLEGKGNVLLDVTTQGDTVSALKKALAGSARLALNDGAIKGINIGQKLRDAKALVKGGKDTSVAGDNSQKTDFSELTASFRIAAGVARNEDLMAKSPLLRLTGAGDIDIGNEQLNYLAKASVVNTSTGQGGKDMENLKGITVPVRLSGPFSQPAWKLEFGGLLEEAAKAKVEEKKEELKQKAADQLKGQLKGLFK